MLEFYRRWRTLSLEVKFREIDGDQQWRKAAIYVVTDAEGQAWGANRIRYPVVHAVTDGIRCWEAKPLKGKHILGV